MAERFTYSRGFCDDPPDFEGEFGDYVRAADYDASQARVKQLESVLNAVIGQVVRVGPWGADKDGNEDGSDATICASCEGTPDGALHKSDCALKQAEEVLPDV